MAIDFTSSNGDPSLPSSLHYLNPAVSFNPYEQAIFSVGSVLQPYDSDNVYPLYGFGAKLRTPDGSFSPAMHCFPLYSGGVEVKGIDGILNVYFFSLDLFLLILNVYFYAAIIRLIVNALKILCFQVPHFLLQ